MELQRDFKVLLESFNGHRVEYVLVGAHRPGEHREVVHAAPDGSGGGLFQLKPPDCSAGGDVL